MSMDVGQRITRDDPTDRVRVGVAELAVATGDTKLTTSGLGSCVGVALVDPGSDVAGLAHVMLPELPRDREATDKPAKSARGGVERLFDAVESAGADPERVEAKLAGGSQMFDFSGVGEAVGRRNVATVREALADVDVPVVGDDVGGDYGRSLELHPASGTLTVQSAHREAREL